MNSQVMKLFAAAAVAAACLLASNAGAQGYPTKPVRLIHGSAPGGATDAAARQLAEHLSGAWKQNVVVDPRPGANSAIGTAAVARATPDGYTLLVAVPSISTFKVLVKELSFDPAKDLAPISLISFSPYLIGVSAALPVNSLAEFIAYAKARPGKLNYGTVGAGHMLVTEYFKLVGGLEIVSVPYNGEVAAIPALAANDIQLYFGTALSMQPAVDSGKIKVLATSGARSPGMPNVPPAAEAGLPGLEPTGFWFGVFAPAGTPREALSAVASEISAFVKKPEAATRFLRVGFVPTSNTPEEFTKFMEADYRRWAVVAGRLGIKPQ